MVFANIFNTLRQQKKEAQTSAIDLEELNEDGSQPEWLKRALAIRVPPEIYTIRYPKFPYSANVMVFAVGSTWVKHRSKMKTIARWLTTAI